MEEIDKDRAAIAWFTSAWDDYLSALPRLLPIILLQAAATAAALPMVRAWHSLVPAAVYSMLVITPLGVGCTLVYIKTARGDRARLADLFAAFPIYPRALAVSLALGLMTVGGLLAFVIPGAVLYLTYCFSEYLVIARGTGIRESFLLSRALTDGWRLRLMPIALLAALLNLLAPEMFRITGPFSSPDVTLDLRRWTIASHLLKTLVFGPWLGLAMARAYNFLLAPRPAEDPENA